MKKGKLAGVLLTFSLVTSFMVPVAIAEERLLSETSDNQLKISDPLSEQLDSTDLDTLFNEGSEQPDDEMAEETNSEPESNSIPDSELDISDEANGQETSQTNSVSVMNESVIESDSDPTIIDQGVFPGGEWAFYSDGLLTISGGFSYSPTSINWRDHVQSIKRVEFVTGERDDLSGSFSSFFKSYENLESVDFGFCDISGVSTFQGAFQNLKKLKKVSFKDVVHSTTPRYNSMDSMFYGCSSLQELDLSGFDTSSVTTMQSMFYGCSSLQELDLSGFDTSSVTTMYIMFSGCSSLVEVDFSGADLSSVTNMISIFSRCSSLVEVDFSGADLSSVTNMNSMFYECSSLVEVDFSGVNLSSVTIAASVFSGCSSLVEVDFSGVNLSSVTNTSNMFFGCSSLQELDLSGLDTSSVTSMSSMFYKCSSLQKLDLSGFDTRSVTSMSSMLGNCSYLEELDLSGFDTRSVTNMSSMFYETRRLMTIHISENFKFHDNSDFRDLPGGYVWQDKNKLNFNSSSDMILYHNETNKTNTYRWVRLYEMTFNAMGGKFDDGSEITVQEKVADEFWEELLPEKENCLFVGWYTDAQYTTPFDFSQPVSKYVRVYAKWSEEYIVNIPAKVSLNSENQLKVSGTNNGRKTLEVNLKNDSNEITNESQLLLSNKKDSNVKAASQLSWEPMKEQSEWNVLTIAPTENGSSKESLINLTQPKNVQAGSYEGTVTFDITYQ